MDIFQRCRHYVPLHQKPVRHADQNSSRARMLSAIAVLSDSMNLVFQVLCHSHAFILWKHITFIKIFTLNMYIYYIHPVQAPVPHSCNSANIYDETQQLVLLHCCPLLRISANYRNCRSRTITASVHLTPRPHCATSHHLTGPILHHGTVSFSFTDKILKLQMSASQWQPSWMGLRCNKCCVHMHVPNNIMQHRQPKQPYSSTVPSHSAHEASIHLNCSNTVQTQGLG